MRPILLLSVFLVSTAPAVAQTFSPISGPNDAIASPICDLINFGFCPQPAPPPPPFPDPRAAVLAPVAPPPPGPTVPHRHRKMHRHVPPANG